MSFERFKREARSKDLSDLNQMVQERKKELFKWNRPVERRLEYGNKDVNPHSKHPFHKVRKELAILNTIIWQKLNQGVKNDKSNN